MQPGLVLCLAPTALAFMAPCLRSLAVQSVRLALSPFAPAGRMTTSSGLRMAFEDALGAQPPLGFWDPLGLLNDADQERFDRLRTVETKHGRISMLAILGHIVSLLASVRTIRHEGEALRKSLEQSVRSPLAEHLPEPQAGIASSTATQPKKAVRQRAGSAPAPQAS